MSRPQTHYEVLKIARDAPQEVVRAAYRALAQKHHPDRGAIHVDANDHMARINAAYNVLSDPALRREYDELLRAQDEQNHPHAPDAEPAGTGGATDRVRRHAINLSPFIAIALIYLVFYMMHSANP